MRQKVLWLHTVVLAIGLVLTLNWQSGSARPSQQTKPAGLEYKIVPIELGELAQGETLLKEFDSQGWELIAVQSLKTTAQNLSSDASSYGRDRKGSFREIPDLKVREVFTSWGKADAYYIFKRAKVGP